MSIMRALVTCLCCGLVGSALPQNIGINADGAAPHASALLDVDVSALPANGKKGLLVPRMTTVQRAAIASPAEALLVFDTSLGQFWYYDGVVWMAVTAGNHWSTRGNAGTAATDAVGSLVGSTTLEFRVANERAGYLADGIPQTSFGHLAMPTATGVNNTAFGKFALRTLTTGTNNTAVGAYALRNITTGSSNTAVGYEALNANTGSRNTAIGYRAMALNTTGFDNTAVGYLALSSNLTGDYNTAVGYQALRYTTASSNTAFGFNALRDNTVGASNTAVGSRALMNNTTGSQNSAMGFQALFNNTTGAGNSAIGANALDANSTGSYNTAFGEDALPACTGSYNTGAGIGSATGLTNGLYNSSCGYNTSLGLTTGDYNTTIGSFAGITGNYNNSAGIGATATPTATNRINIGVVVNNNLTGGYGTWQNFSDARFKRDVQADVPGLDFVLRLRPVTYALDAELIEKASGAWYVMDTLSKGEYRAGYIQRLAEVSAARQTGFIAQEVEAAAAAIGYDFDGVHHPVDANDHYTLGYELFTLPLIQAVKEQHAVIEELEQVNVMLQQRIAEMEVANGPLQKAP